MNTYNRNFRDVDNKLHVSVERIFFKSGHNAFGIVKRNRYGVFYLNINGDWLKADTTGFLKKAIMIWHSRQKADKALRMMTDYRKGGSGKKKMKKWQKKNVM